MHHGFDRLHRHVMVQMAVSPRFMGVGSYEFCSRRKLLEVAGSHAGGHGIAHPAAQEQQEDHGDEQGAAHK